MVEPMVLFCFRAFQWFLQTAAARPYSRRHLERFHGRALAYERLYVRNGSTACAVLRLCAVCWCATVAKWPPAGGPTEMNPSALVERRFCCGHRTCAVREVTCGSETRPRCSTAAVRGQSRRSWSSAGWARASAYLSQILEVQRAVRRRAACRKARPRALSDAFRPILVAAEARGQQIA